MYYMTFISRCLGMLKSRNDKLVWAKDELKKYLRHHIIHEYDHIFRLNRHNGTTFLKKSKVGARAWFDMQYLVLWSCGWESPSQPEYYCWQIYVCPLPPPTTLLCTHTNTHKHTQTHTNTHKDTFFRQTAARKVCPGSKHNAAVLCAKMVDLNIVHVWIWNTHTTSLKAHGEHISRYDYFKTLAHWHSSEEKNKTTKKTENEN